MRPSWRNWKSRSGSPNLPFWRRPNSQTPVRPTSAGPSDLRDTATVVTIDPLTFRDFDEAVSLERRDRGWLLGVHVADVSHYVLPETSLDKEARKRGTSVYLPTRVVPMLPERLSNDLCSLREGVARLTLSVLLHYDAKLHCLLDVGRDLWQHRQTAADVKASDTDLHTGGPQRTCNIDGSGKLVRLDSDESNETPAAACPRVR